MRTKTRGKQSKTRRRVEADRRQEARAQRTPSQQATKLTAGGWTAKREMVRLFPSK